VSLRTLSSGQRNCILGERACPDDFLSGRKIIKEYESSPGASRAFCSVCGSPVFARVTGDAEFIRVRLGTLERAAHATVTAHVWVHSKPGWYSIEDDLPQYGQSIVGPPNNT
jgi:hypothetical protein